jgi:hypothetical protein
VSYDIWLTIDTGGPDTVTTHEVGNYTSNVSPMWKKAFGYLLREMDGRNAREMVEDLERAVRHMRDPENLAKYEAMNPENGWGNHEGAT